MLNFVDRAISRALFMTVSSLFVACASAPPPKELVDARSAYARSEVGPAQQLNPAGLHDAKLQLDKAEQTYSNDPGSDAATDEAYLALRRAELVDIEASRISWQQRRDRAMNDVAQAQAKTAASMQAELRSAKSELENERAARIAAEGRAKDVLNKLVAANAAGVKEEPRGTVITLAGSSLFASNESSLLPSAQGVLDQIAEVQKGQKNKKLLVEGHTDARGSESANVALSKARADSVSSYLISQGVPADRVSSAGLGSSRPVADNNSADGRAQNRRVEIVIQGAPGK